MNALTPNFYYYASQYLDIWIDADREFINGLASSGAEERRSALEKAANYYAVSRNFRRLDSETNKHKRLGLALELLDDFRCAPTSDDDVIADVNKLALSFKETYGREATSAASKFLWMKFQSPVVIYDLQAYSCLCHFENLKSPEWSYSKYLENWRKHYREHLDCIREACSELYQFKKFTRAYREPDETIQSWSTQPWFMERVFDIYLWRNGTAEEISGIGESLQIIPPPPPPAPSAER